jgi:site-specific DNA-methyltransferase (adenine-specific)
VDQAVREFGRFTLDPAAQPDNAKAPRWYTPEDNGLQQPWHGRVWLNPPYGRTVGQWLAKAVSEVEAGRAKLVVALLPARIDARWWRQYVVEVRPRPLVRLWPKRIQYQPGQDAPFPSAMVVYGRLTGRHGQTGRICPVCQEVFWPDYANRKTCGEACKKNYQRTVSRIQPIDVSRIRPSIRDSNASPIRDIPLMCDVVVRLPTELHAATVYQARQGSQSVNEAQVAVWRAGVAALAIDMNLVAKEYPAYFPKPGTSSGRRLKLLEGMTGT